MMLGKKKPKTPTAEKEENTPEKEDKQPEKAVDIRTELKNSLQRVQAEFENFRKRTDREREQIVKQSNRDIVMEIIPILDIFEMALATIKEHNETTKGFEMVLEQLKQLLKKHHVKIINKVDVPINPKIHEDIGESDKGGDQNKVAEIVSKGYMVGDYVIRVAKVRRYGFRGCGSGPKMAEEMKKQIGQWEKVKACKR